MSHKSVSESILRPRHANQRQRRQRGVSFYGFGRSSSSRSSTPTAAARPFPENSRTFRETSRPYSDLLYNNSSASTTSSSLSEFLKRRPRSEAVLEAVTEIHERMMRANGPREDNFREDSVIFRERKSHHHSHDLSSPRLLLSGDYEAVEDGGYEPIGDAGKTDTEH